MVQSEEEKRNYRKAYQKAYYLKRKAMLDLMKKEHGIAVHTKKGRPRMYKNPKEMLLQLFDVCGLSVEDVLKTLNQPTQTQLQLPLDTPTAQDSEHSLVSPSSLERICGCPSSLMLTKDMPNTESEAAKEGTLFHSYMEDLLKNPPQDPIELQDRLGAIEDLEMAYHVQEAYNYISNILAKLNPLRIDIELKLPQFYSVSDFGTLDFGCLYQLPNSDKNTWELFILDWKYGKGHYVEVENNKQITAYAYSYYQYLKKIVPDLKVVRIITVVYQPRCESEDGRRARCFSYSMEELKTLCRNIENGVSVAYKILHTQDCGVLNQILDANTSAGEHCLFCKAKTMCKKYKEYVSKDALTLIDDIKTDAAATEFKNISLLSDEERVKVIQFGETILPKLKSYIEDVMASMQARLEAGEIIQGLKLVQGRGRRKWIDDEKKIIDTLESVGIDCTKQSLKTLTEMQAALKAINRTDLLDSLVEMSEGKTRVALDSDKRSTVSSALISDL